MIVKWTPNRSEPALSERARLWRAIYRAENLNDNAGATLLRDLDSELFDITASQGVEWRR